MDRSLSPKTLHSSATGKFCWCFWNFSFYWSIEKSLCGRIYLFLTIYSSEFEMFTPFFSFLYTETAMIFLVWTRCTSTTSTPSPAVAAMAWLPTGTKMRDTNWWHMKCIKDARRWRMSSLIPWWVGWLFLLSYCVFVLWWAVFVVRPLCRLVLQQGTLEHNSHLFIICLLLFFCTGQLVLL